VHGFGLLGVLVCGVYDGDMLLRLGTTLRLLEWSQLGWPGLGMLIYPHVVECERIGEVWY